MKQLTGVLLLLALAGCATARPAPFFCGGKPPPKSPAPRVLDSPVGELDLKVLEPRLLRPAPEPASWDDEGEKRSARIWYRQQRLHVVADSVPLQAVALALSTALGVHVEMEPSIADVRVFVYHPETTVMQFLDAIESQASLHVEYEDDGFSIERNEEWDARRRAFYDRGPTKVRLLRMGDRFTAQHFAEIYCHDYATERGRATAYDDFVILRDTLDALTRAEGLKVKIDGAEPAAQDAPATCW